MFNVICIVCAKCAASLCCVWHVLCYVLSIWLLISVCILCVHCVICYVFMCCMFAVYLFSVCIAYYVFHVFCMYYVCLMHVTCVLCAMLFCVVQCTHIVYFVCCVLFPLCVVCYTLYKDTPVDVYQGQHTLYNLGARRQVGFSLGSSEALLFGD